MLRPLILIMTVAFSTLATAGLHAQELDRIAAVVNDEPISLLDVIARVKLAMISSNIPDSVENRRSVLPQVIRKMIDERLQLQEAERLKLTVAAADIDNGIAMIEKQNRMAPGTLIPGLTRSGVDATTIRNQIRADMTWVRLVSRVVSPQVRVGEEEVTDRHAIMRARQGQPELQLAEIFLPVDRGTSENDARALGDHLITQLRAGTPFPSLARQFSRSPTAANGGNMGWVSPENLDDAMNAVVATLQKGQVSQLIRVADGYQIVALIDQRIVGEAIDPEASEISFARMILPTPKGAQAPSRIQLLGQAAKLTAGLQNCADFDTAGHRLGATKVDRLGPSTISTLSADLRAILTPLPPNRASAPSDTPDGIQVLMICNRHDVTKIEGITREQARRIVENERTDMLSRRYIRDLRRQAFIDIRL